MHENPDCVFCEASFIQKYNGYDIVIWHAVSRLASFESSINLMQVQSTNAFSIFGKVSLPSVLLDIFLENLKHEDMEDI